MEKSTSFLTIMRYWAYNILSFDTFVQLFLMFWIDFACFPWFFGSKIKFWWKSLFFVKKPYFSRPKNPLFTKFSKNTQKFVIMTLLHWLIKTWILEQSKCQYPENFRFFSNFLNLKIFFKFCHFWLKYVYMTENKFFGEVGNFILAKIHGKQTKYKK